MNLDYSKNNKVDSAPYEHNRGLDITQPDGLALHSYAANQIEQMADRIDHLEFMVDAQHKMITGINKYLKAYVANRITEVQDLNESWPK